MKGEGTNRRTRHAYGNGGLPKVQALAPSINKGRLRNVLGCKFGQDYCCSEALYKHEIALVSSACL